MFLSILIVLNLVAVCLESVESFNSLYRTPLIIFETISVSIFLLEYSCVFGPSPRTKKAEPVLQAVVGLIIFLALPVLLTCWRFFPACYLC